MDVILSGNWTEIILVIASRNRAARSFHFEITCMISDQLELHSVQLPLLNAHSDLNFCYCILHNFFFNLLEGKKI